MRAAGERQKLKKASCLCRAKVGSAGRFPKGYCCCSPDGVEHGIYQANSLLPAGIRVIPTKSLCPQPTRGFGGTKTCKRLEKKPRRIPAGRTPWLLTPNPLMLVSFPACKHDSLHWGLPGNCRGSAGGFAWTFIGFLLPNSQFERLRVGKGLGEEEEPRGQGGWAAGGGRIISLLAQSTRHLFWGNI